MERRQLNFDAPILSTRRYPLPSNPTDLLRQKRVKNPLFSGQEPHSQNRSVGESEKVTKPGTVPFLWEQYPGRRKGQVEIQECVSSSMYHFEERFDDHNTRRPHTYSISLSNSDLVSGTHSDCRDEQCSDGAESFSWSESGVMNRSLSARSSKSFIIDKETRDLMMRRFLPAAKAAVLESSEHVRKPRALDEQPKQVRKVAFGEQRLSHETYCSSPLLDERSPRPYPYYGKLIDHLESQGKVQKCAVPIKKSWKTWGAIPQLIAKNSFRLLKPHLGSKEKALSPTSRHEPRGFKVKSLSGPLDKNTFSQFFKKKFHSGLLSGQLQGVDNSLTKDSNQFWNNSDLIHPGTPSMRRYRSGSLSPYRNELPKSPLLRGYQSANASPFRDHQITNESLYENELPKYPLRGYQSAKGCGRGVSLSPLRNEVPYPWGFCPEPEEAENQCADSISQFHKPYKGQDLQRNEAWQRVSSSGPVAYAKEKTLYVDNMDLHLPIPKSSYRKSGPIVYFSGEKSNVFAGTRQSEKNKCIYDTSPIISDSEEEVKATLKYESTKKVLHSSKSFSPREAYLANLLDKMKLSHSHDDSRRTLECISEEQLKDIRDSDFEARDVRGSLKSPPLPKMPSQHRIGHASHYAATRNASPQSRRTVFSKQGQKGLRVSNPQRNFTVKNSKLGRNQLRYSGELTPLYRHREACEL